MESVGSGVPAEKEGMVAVTETLEETGRSVRRGGPKNCRNYW